MRILILSDEPWSDSANGNNVFTNWFRGFDAEFASIYCSPGLPDNACCSRYFQVTDKMMAKSLLGGKRAGRAFAGQGTDSSASAPEAEDRALYARLKKITTEPLRLAREWLWLLGRYDLAALRAFVEDFAPDIVFSIRMGTMKLLRLERIIHEMTDAPFYAFVGDDEYSLRQFSLSPTFWLRRFGVRRSLRKNVRFYRKYYCMTREQADYYARIFPCETGVLNKCGDFSRPIPTHSAHTPIVLIYAGKLYCNRWKVLRTIAKTLQSFNRDAIRFQLRIYTRDRITPAQNRALNDGRSSILMGAAAPQELPKIYAQADIALHVESSDLKNRLATRLSFSTKLIDCMESGCAVMAFCWDQQAGYRHLERTGSGFCVSDAASLSDVLQSILNDPALLDKYALRAQQTGEQYHKRETIQAMLKADFSCD
ncbi:MAG: hypothetical protein IJS31_04980 [Oscillospiraceae bacterium]|nr:hypothetical protein [Oscillospiraceae bacterium]